MGRKVPGAPAVVLLLCLSVAAQEALTSSSAQSSRQVVQPDDRTRLLQQMNKQVQLEGFFYNGSIPMLVRNMELVQGDTPIPPDKYVPITGPIPSSFKPGAKVRIGGQVQKPTGEKLPGEALALQVTARAQASVVQAPPSAILNQSALAVAIAPPAVTPLPEHYALLIGTGMNAANDYVRYWNDLVRMYQLLISEGYNPANIRVVYASGVPKSPSMPVHYAATMGGITTAFTYFVPKVKADGRMYILVVGQGAPPGSIPGQPTAYWTWLGIPMTPAAFAIQVNRIATYQRMVIHMNQSFSGGFIPYLMRPDRIIITAAAAHSQSWAHPSLYYGNFNYWYLSALRGHLLFSEAPVNADANGNGRVSLAEAYNYTLPRPGGPGSPPIPPISSQMPMFEDTGGPPARYGHLPGAGEGLVGIVTYLW
jgi:hypothetical protein